MNQIQLMNQYYDQVKYRIENGSIYELEKLWDETYQAPDPQWGEIVRALMNKKKYSIAERLELFPCEFTLGDLKMIQMKKDFKEQLLDSNSIGRLLNEYDALRKDQNREAFSDYLLRLLEEHNVLLPNLDELAKLVYILIKDNDVEEIKLLVQGIQKFPGQRLTPAANAAIPANIKKSEVVLDKVIALASRDASNITLKKISKIFPDKWIPGLSKKTVKKKPTKRTVEALTKRKKKEKEEEEEEEEEEESD